MSEKMQYALDTIQSVSSGLVCVCVCESDRVYLRVSVDAADRKRRVSVGSLGAGLAHRQTNTLHYRPVYLINWATLSAAQHSAAHDCQQHPGSLEARLHANRPDSEFTNTKPDLPPDCLKD